MLPLEHRNRIHWKMMEMRLILRSLLLSVKPDPADEDKARRAIFWLYTFMAIGILLPLVLFFIFG